MNPLNLFKKRLVFEEMKGPLVIIIMGPQGSGKGTQGELLHKHFGIPLVTMGQIYRDEIAKGTELGKLTASIINQGNIMPDKITNQLFAERLKQPDMARGFILDGYPRSLVQAEYVQTLSHPTLVILLDIPRAETIRRLAGRRVCADCKLNFNIATLDQGVTKCTKCGGKLEARADDVPEVIDKRLSVYETETMPAIRWYQKMGIARKISGVGIPRDVWKRVLAIIPERREHP